MASVVGNGCRSLGFGSLGTRSSGFTCTWRQITGNGGQTHWVMNVCVSEMTYSHFSLSGTEVQIKTSFESFSNEVWIGRHLTKAVVPDRRAGGKEVGREGEKTSIVISLCHTTYMYMYMYQNVHVVHIHVCVSCMYTCTCTPTCTCVSLTYEARNYLACLLDPSPPIL